MHRNVILLAVATGLLGFGLLYLYLERYETRVSGGTLISVVVALQDISPGTVISDAMLGMRKVPQSYVEERHVRTSDAKRIIGMRLANELRVGEAVLWTDLATVHEAKRDLSNLVADGMRAVSIRADAQASFGGLVRPGDRVDVLLSLGRDGEKKLTISILQNVMVLAVGADMGEPMIAEDGSRDSLPMASFANQIVVSATPEQAQLLAYSQERGRLSLVLRNPNDIAVIEGIPETTEADILEAQRRINLQRRLKLGSSAAGVTP